MRPWVLAAVVVSSVLAGFALGRVSAVSHTEAPAKDEGPIVARWSGGELSAARLRMRVLHKRDAAGLSSLDPARAQAFVDEALTEELLAAEAKKRGLASDPSVDDAVVSALSKRLVEQEIEQGKAAVDDATVRAYYDAHKAEFDKPERVRVEEIKGGKADAGPGQDLGALSKDELRAKLGDKAADQVWLMVRIGEVSPVLETNEGPASFRLLGREGAAQVSYEQAKEMIRSRLWYEKRDEALRKFEADLRAKLGLKVDDGAVRGVLADIGVR